MMPAPAMKPIMDMAVKRDWSHDDQRSFERLEPADNQDVDKHQDRRECQSQIAEDFG